MTTETFTSGCGTWTVPAGVADLKIEVWGGDNSGAYDNEPGGGRYCKKILVTEGKTIFNYTIGAGGDSKPELIKEDPKNYRLPIPNDILLRVIDY